MIIPLIALLSAALFTGAAFYITLVEHPARMGLEDSARLRQWQSSYRRALLIQSGLAVTGGAAGLLAASLTADWLLAAGSVALLANWPFTLLVIFPVNNRLMALNPGAAGLESREMLVTWGRLHGVRSVLGAAAMLLFAVAFHAAARGVAPFP